MRYILKPISSKRVLELSNGCVQLPKTVTSSLNPIKNGLFCEAIFGSQYEYRCACGILKGIEHTGKKCAICGVEIDSTINNKNKYGHIELSIPIFNVFCLLLYSNIIGINRTTIESVLKGHEKIEIEYTNKGRLVTKNNEKFNIITGKGETSVISLYNINKMIDINNTIKLSTDNMVVHTLKKMSIHHISMDDIFLTHILVLPTLYRPIVDISGNHISKSYNELYMKIIEVSNRVKIINDMGSTQKEILIAEAVFLQKAVQNLFVDGSYNRRSKLQMSSIFNSFEAKEGIFRQNLLGKRLDFSARSVITSDPKLSIDDINIPIGIAYELFKPFIISHLKKNTCNSHKNAIHLWNSLSIQAISSLHEVVKDKVILFNRQPSLHRYSIMAFNIKLHHGKHIGLPPFVCSPFGADFDGDGCSLHLPLTKNAQDECKRLLYPSKNLISYANGKLLMSLSHEMIIGTNYMTRLLSNECVIKENSIDRVNQLYEQDVIKINTKIFFKFNDKYIETCYGRLIIGDLLKCNINNELCKKELEKCLYKYCLSHTSEETKTVIDKLISLSFEYCTKSGLSVCYEDCKIMDTIKAKEFSDAKKYNSDLMYSESDLLKQEELIIRNWNKVIKKLNNIALNEYKENPLSVMYKSGARLTETQFSQILVAKGIYADAKGNISKKPIESSYTDGLNIHDYFYSCKAARKAGSDKKDVTPNAGYLTRQLVSASRELKIVEDDCGTTKTIDIFGASSKGRFDENGNVILHNTDGLVAVRSPITCESKKGICKKCYGLDITNHSHLIKKGSQIGLIAAQSISEVTTQLSMKSKHTSGAANLEDKHKVVACVSDCIIEEIIVEKHISKIITRTNNNEIYTYLLFNDRLEILTSIGDKTQTNDVIAQYSEEISQIDISNTMPKLMSYFNIINNNKYGLYSTRDGIINLLYNDKKRCIDVYIDNIFFYHTKGLISVADGQYILKGDIIEKGMFNAKEFYEQTNDLKLTARLWLEYIISFYKKECINILPIHYEIIFRAMSDLVQINELGHLGIRSKGEKGTVKIFGVSDVAKKYPRLLKSASFGFSKQIFLEEIAILRKIETCQTENIMMGRFIGEVE